MGFSTQHNPKSVALIAAHETLLHHAKHKLGPSAVVGVHVTPLRSSPSKLAGVGSPPGVFSPTLKTKKESPFAIYLMAMERVWKEYQEGQKKVGGAKKTKLAFVYASNAEEESGFKKQAKENGGWDVITIRDAMSPMYEPRQVAH